jgi:hypothetical protein
MESKQLSLKPSSFARFLGIAAFLLILASIAGQCMKYLTGHGHIFGLVWLFNVDAEKNIPSGFSALLLLFASLILALISTIEKKRTGRFPFHWTILCLGFLVMGGDEAFSFHEMLMFHEGKWGLNQMGIFNFALTWILPAAALIIVLSLFFLRFWWRLPSRTRSSFLIAAIIYLGGSMGMELIGGWYVDLHGMDNLTYNLLAAIEEGLEMAGVIYFIWSLLTYLSDMYGTICLHFEKD